MRTRAVVATMALALTGGGFLGTPASAASAGSPAQEWVVNNPRAVIVQRTSGHCLTSPGGADSAAVTRGCSNAPGQRFVLEGGEIRNQSSDLCLTATGLDKPTVMRPCNGSAGQRFSVQGPDIRSQASGRCLTATGPDKPVLLTPCRA
ncbi:RICIN domain-containing protein [Streptomyces sp. NPDC001678]|uniref:RICIN domain-containing protein n=1 Tax=Streptomyces sp. NPDC001678 TaxID=3364599 RepID=UPI0036C1BAB8